MGEHESQRIITAGVSVREMMIRNALVPRMSGHRDHVIEVDTEPAPRLVSLTEASDPVIVDSRQPAG